jgi:hypothetical protein
MSLILHRHYRLVQYRQQNQLQLRHHHRHRLDKLNQLSHLRHHYYLGLAM